MAGPPAAAAPGLTPNEPATAVAGRSTVYLEATFTGYLRYAAPDGTSRQERVTVHRRCGGVIVNPDGHVATADGCVRPDERELLAEARYALAQAMVEAERLPADGLEDFVRVIGETASFSGPRPGTKPSSALWGQLGVARPGITAEPAIRASVVEPDRGTAQQSLALVKLSRSGLSAIEVGAGAGPEPGSEVVVLGYGPDEPETGSGDYRQRARPVEASDWSGPDRLAGDGLGPSFRGSPVLDTDGRLLAILDSDPSTTDGRSRLLVPASEVAALLAEADVANRLSEVDRAYRDGLRAYFAGQFSTAVRRFDELLRLAPSHSSAQTYRERAQHRLEVDGDAVENSAHWLRYLLSAAAGVLLIVAAGRIRRFIPVLLSGAARRTVPRRWNSGRPAARP
ncbi:trypsin-like peptidase domain-containing protein [Plantactinospora sp. KLBMP9567]|uniref:trypsin-like peptidase domain-containing protein n=1 Tax=Plantactinospora sp. KLBMP9567 TaxID=3085900 RepID=UPI0029824FF4|nr:trypsin-like peptidase domain-containing protein [Plantactinospora sp. KLBMP9567]MDW5322484.1 trypsin-like peptidase domain-containing protein [Plantactinospora sp. KLBMP9567]